MSYTSISQLVSNVHGPSRGLDTYAKIEDVSEDHHFYKAAVTNSDGVTTTPARNANPHVIQLHTLDDIASNIRRRDAAVVKKASLTVIPGPRAIGQAITVMAAWAPSSWGNVTTAHELAQLPHALVCTFGGALTIPTSIELVLPDSVTHILKSSVGAPTPKLFFFCRAHSITGAGKVNDDTSSWMHLHLRVDYETFGGPITSF